MTITTSYSPITSAGNGVATAIPVTWKFFDATDLVVTKIASTGVETVQTITTHYTVTGGEDSDGRPQTGTVTMVTAPAVGETIRITRSTSKLQESTWSESDAFPQATIESALDRLTMIAQEGSGGGSANDDITGDVMQLNSAGAQNYWDGEGSPIRVPFLEVTEASAPATPDSGYGRVYTKTDGYLYHKNDDGTETNLTTGAADAATSAAAAASSASAAATSATSASTSAAAAAAAVSAGAFKWALDTSTSMADPGTGELRANNASWASVTAIAISDLSADTGNPDVSAIVLSWDDSSNSANRGQLTLRKLTAPQEFVQFNITGASTDNTGWTQLAVTHVAGTPSWSASDQLLVVFARTGNQGTPGAGTGDLLAANNLSDVANAATARTNLGLAIGTNVQAYDADLDAVAGLSATGLVRRTGAGAFSAGTTVATAEIADDAVTYAKLQNVSATSRILGRKTASAGDAEECTLSEILDFIGSAAQGDILYRGASAWARLGAGTSGHYLQTQGAGANPQWAAVSGSGFPSTTAMLFVQTAAPTGWTKSTTHNDKTLRVVSGTASSGGSNSFTTAMVNAFNSGATTLTTSQIPSHTHSSASGSSINAEGPGGAPISVAQAGTSGSAGTGGSHTHTVQLNVQYVDVIIATKD